jgi:hypothetical protein
MKNALLVHEFSLYWIFFAVALFPLLLFVKQPYGRHIRKGWGLSISNRVAWIIMEIPALVIFASIFFYFQNYSSIVLLPFLLWVIHYIHRTIIFPLRIKTKGKFMPIIIVVFGFFFNMVNASINGLSLQNHKPEIIEPSDFYRIITGLVFFIGGMIINIYSDSQLIHLRKNSSTTYQIPRKFLFEWVSCPNYLGEIIEWTGFAIIAWNSAALSFAVWTIVNLLPRALNHHKWYKEKFIDYPDKRKAIIPYLL